MEAQEIDFPGSVIVEPVNPSNIAGSSGALNSASAAHANNLNSLNPSSIQGIQDTVGALQQYEDDRKNVDSITQIQNYIVEDKGSDQF